MKIFLAIALAAGAAVAETLVEIPMPIERLMIPGLPNLARVEGNVYRGGRPQLDQGGLDSLQKLGVKTVIDLQGGDLASARWSRLPAWSRIILRLEPGESPDAIKAETAAGAEAGVEVENVPLDSLDPLMPWEVDGLDKVLQTLKSADKPVYVHCEHGKDRTGLVIALYRMRYDGWTRAQASAEMKTMGHNGRLDGYFTGNMDLDHVLALYPNLVPNPQ